MNDQQRQQNYDDMVKRLSPKSEKPFSLLKAFVVGGLICTLGQGFKDLALQVLRLDQEGASLFCSFCLIFLSALLTGLGVYDRLGKFAGAGSIVPITGFANSVASPALEFKAEGMITGLAAKMFTVAGPIIVYGVLSGTAVGIIYYLLGL